MNKVKPSGVMFCVVDPAGVMVHTTVSLDEQGAINEWITTEQSMNWVHNAVRKVQGQQQVCAPSWEGFEAQGYRVIPIELIPIIKSSGQG